MHQPTNLLIEVPADMWALFHDDKIVTKYRRILGQLVAARFLSPKRDLKIINERIELIHRQIRGRQISLLKASQSPVAHEPVREAIDNTTLKLIFPYVTINQ